MRASKKLFFLLLLVFCLLSLNVTAVNASDEICFNLHYDPVPVGGGPTILKLGIMDYGNYRVALSGTAASYVMPGVFGNVGLVHGNAEMVNDKVEFSLSGTAMWSDNKTVSVYSYHLRLDPTTLSGVYTLSSDSIMDQKGLVSPISCSDL